MPEHTQRPAAAPARHSTVLGLMSACVVLAVALVAAVNLALPDLRAGSLHPSSAQLLWIVDSYLLLFAGLLIPAGALGDRRGPKGALLCGLGLFTAGCLLTALAPNVTVLVAARGLAGAGAALVMPATLSLAVRTAPHGRRAHAVAVWTGATGVAGLLGNLGGGLVLQYLPWQGLFWVAAPAALLLLALTARLTPRLAAAPAGPTDPAGTALLVLGSLALLTALIEGPGRGWDSPPVLGSFALAALLLGALAAHGMRARNPLVDPRLLRSRPLRAGVLGVSAIFFGMYALFFVNAQYLQYAKGYSPALAGLAIGPLAVAMLVVSRLSPRLSLRIGPRATVAAGLACLAAGLGLLSLVDGATPYPPYAGILLVLAVGMGLATPSLSLTVIGSLPAERAGLGSGLNGAAREFGSALGVAAMGTVLASRTGGFTDGMSAGFRLAAAVVAVLGAVTVVWLRPVPGRAESGSGPAGNGREAAADRDAGNGRDAAADGDAGNGRDAGRGQDAAEGRTDAEPGARSSSSGAQAAATATPSS
ncbi:MFS transporter [Streptomyces qinglanensis]|uniref:Predicted arabinose efflux permease, MFS family n=1 Tax=Streptomyces qinglanensis TaxID=943816 RepID=A0A1H9VAW6_9ACTN|nr:MFS transporter [Streptomyces qinglanensis]SES18970.1 Predicted arabinose efflux permease, MFS family [Streptomyces qinglanensis]